MQAVIGSLRVNLGVDTAAFGDGLKAAGTKLAAFGATLRAAVVPVAVAGAAAIAGMGVAVRGVIDNADEMSKAASKFGVPIEELSRLKYAADLSDVSLQTLGTSLGRLSRNMSDAASGSKSQVEAFKAIGVSVTNADGTLRASSEVLQDISDKFAAMPDGAAKTAAAMELMGRSGAEMIPLLNGGSAALQAMMAEADTFGQVFTAEMGSQAEAFNDNITRLQGGFGNLAADLTQRLLPYLAQFTDWLVQNGPAISATAGRLVEFGAKVIYAGQQIAGFIKVVGDALVGGVQAVANFVQELAAGFARGVETSRQFIVDVEAAIAGMRDRFLQIGRDIIDGLLAGLREKWESVKAWFGNLADSIPQWVRERLGIQSPSTVFAEIGQHIMSGLQLGLESNQGEVESGVKSFASRIADTFADVLMNGADFKDAFQGLLAETLGSVGGNWIDQGIGAIAGALGIPGFANGTMNAPRGLALVGERGPEFVRMRGGEQVIPNHELSSLGGPSSMSINVNVSGARGNSEVMAMVQAGVSAGLRAYDNALPGRMQQISRDPWRR